VWSKKIHIGFRWEHPKIKEHLEELGVHARIIYKWILLKLEEYRTYNKKKKG
jgi:hypothetical protein